jgi:hypothetical protein
MVTVAKLLGLYNRFYALDLPSFGKSENRTRVLSLVELTDALGEWTTLRQLTFFRISTSSWEFAMILSPDAPAATA